ncbi:NAD(P)-dependent oxidoreductase [Nocardioidaceae bacterium SCSIO 66511]|nr:NAD(P)-dependent oxidoreductase [Nocardioidaceae bacterium SCSIO 66511]
MKVFVTGATGAMGRAVSSALHLAGHQVVGLARHPERAHVLESMNVEPAPGSLFDRESLAEAMSGCDVVCNLATHVPVSTTGLRPRAWRVNDRIRSEGSRVVAAAARDVGVPRLIQESVSFLYADAAEEWITESSPIEVTRVAEPVVLAETHAQEFACASRESVVLRFGNIIGDDALTRRRIARARAGHAVGMGNPESWTHVIHSDDVGSAVLAALTAPTGIYNVGAAPIRRGELAAAYAEAAEQEECSFYPRLVVKLGGERLEWMTRSQRVSSDEYARAAGWKPTMDEFGAHWLRPLIEAGVA